MSRRFMCKMIALASAWVAFSVMAVSCSAQATTKSIPAEKAAVIKPISAENVLDARLYKLSAGDTVRIDVLGEADLSVQLLIDATGYVTYPFLGRIQASGLTVGQLAQRIHEGLTAGYLVNPDVRVAIAQYRPIYVGGQVRQAGAYAYTLGLTVDKALTLAGGVTQFGSLSRIYLQREGQPKGQRINVGLDSLVFPGDTLMVEERLF